MWAMFSISMTILLFSPLSEVMCVTLLKWADLYINFNLQELETPTPTRRFILLSDLVNC